MNSLVSATEPDLLVIGTHERTKFKRFMQGAGVREKVTDHTRVPVLCVRIPSEQLNDRLLYADL